MSDNVDNMQEFAQEVQETIIQQEVPQQEPVYQESSREINARILRERAEAAERRAAELEYHIMQNQKQSYQPPAEEEDIFDISDDAYVEGHQVKKYLKKLDKKVQEATRRLEQQTQDTALKYAESSLKTQFTDFDEIVNEENLAKLSRMKAPLFRSIMSNKDIYDRGYSAYEAIKNLLPQDKQNYAKPAQRQQRPLSASNAPTQLGETPITRIHDYDRRVLTPERKAEILRNLEAAKRNR